ncbi:MAG: T9SS type A sorting domain-containing protein, partial [Bacteroidetes bacterium]
NDDKDFEDAGELVYSSAGTTTTVSGSFTVPSGTSTGAKRMRIIMKDGSISGPCISYTYGEVEDYTVNITGSAPAPCNAPGGLAVNNLTSTDVTLNWNAVSGANDYTVDVKVSTSSSWTSFSASSNTLNLTGLSEGTTYNWRVRTNCSSTNSSFTNGSDFTAPTSAPVCSNNYESNETRSAAATISTNTDIISMIGSNGDVDYFKFSNTSAAKNIKITLTNLPYDYDLYLYNSSGSLLYKSENGSNNSETITYNGAPVSTYYIRVIGYNGAYSSSNCYTLRANISGSTFKINPYAQSVAKENATSFLNVMPNPSTDGHFTLNLENVHVGKVNIEVYDEAGRLVVSKVTDKEENFMKEAIDLSDKKRGLYIVRIFNEQFQQTERIVYLK